MGTEFIDNDFEGRLKRLEDELALTKKLQEEGRLTDRKLFFKTLADVSFEGLFIVKDGCFIESNDAGCEMFGYAYEEFIGLDIKTVFPEEFSANIQRNNGGTYEVPCKRRDGSGFYAQIKGRAVSYRDELVGVVVVRDIGDLKFDLKRLPESETKYQELVENAADAILICNLNGGIAEVNKGFEQLTGFMYEEIEGHPISVLFPPDVWKEKPLDLRKLKQAQGVMVEIEIVDSRGKWIPVEMNLRRTSFNQCFILIRDLRKRREAESLLVSINKELMKARDKAEESDRLKSAFLANISHEVRTPMNGIIGFSQLLRNKEIDEETRQEYVEVIISSGQQLLNIITNVLEISRIQTGQVQLKPVFLELPPLFIEQFAFFEPMASKKGIKLIKSIPEESANQTMMGDRTKIMQVISKLLSNAFKFTLAGQVTFGYVLEDSSVKFFVKDTGQGIAPENFKSIFDRFVKVDESDDTQRQGAGLGLPICKKLVEMMGGKIWVESEVDKGSDFYFELPRGI